MPKLLIADGTEEFRLALAEQVSDAYVVKMSQQGKEALELMHSFRPDMMVLDLTMPGLDGVTLLQRAAEAGLSPVVLATTRFLNDYVVEAVSQLGVGYVMVKPCDVQAVADRLNDLKEHLDRPVLTQPDPRTVVTNLLLTLGISTKLNGYGYLREAILMAVRQPGLMVTKEIYPEVGKICNASKEQVERSIRSAIVSAWKRRDAQAWQQYFRPDPDGEIGRPTNAAFITRLADCVRTGIESEW